jgi:Ala-tRNA(Pro) deacylase
MSAPATADDLFAFLETLGIETTTVTHPPLFTVEDSRALRGDLPGGHTKNLFLKDKKGRLFLVTCDESRQVNLKALEKAIGAARVSFGKPDLLLEVLGITPGAVTTFSLINDRNQPQRVTFAIDTALLAHNVIHCHPLHNEATTAISPNDLMRFVEACGHQAIKVDFEDLGGKPPE